MKGRGVDAYVCLHARVALDGEPYTTLPGELHCVAEQVDEHLANTPRVPAELARGTRRAGTAVQPIGLLSLLSPRLDAHEIDGALDHLVEVEPRLLDGDGASLDAREVEHVLDQHAQSIVIGSRAWSVDT